MKSQVEVVMERRAFVAGATGLTGRFVVEYLIEAGIKVTAHIRPDSSRVDHWTRYFARLGADTSTVAWDQEEMTRALASLTVAGFAALVCREAGAPWFVVAAVAGAAAGSPLPAGRMPRSDSRDSVV